MASVVPRILLVLLLAACGSSPKVDEARKAPEGRCLADRGCPEPPAVPPCTGPAPAMTVKELSEGTGLQDELDERGESRPRLAPGEYAADGYAHTSLAICTGAACMGGTCCNSCGGN